MTDTQLREVAPQPSTVSQHALEGLRRSIAAGDLRPGQRVPQEDVAAQLGVSVAPVREALRTLEQEGQVTYLPRRGYFVTELRIEDLREIYDLRRVMEARAARHALPLLAAADLDVIARAAAECRAAEDTGDVTAELDANRRFHLAMFDVPGHPHTLRVIRMLWESTEAYRALYYNSQEERRRANDAHERILAAVQARDADELVSELDAHRDRALEVLQVLLAPAVA